MGLLGRSDEIINGRRQGTGSETKPVLASLPFSVAEPCFAIYTKDLGVHRGMIHKEARKVETTQVPIDR